LILLLLAVAGGLWLLFALRGVILLLLLSMLFAYLIAPLVEFLCRPVTWGRRPWAIPRPLAIAMVYLALFAIPAVAVLSVMHRHLLEYRGSGGLVSELLTPTQSAPDAARRTPDHASTPTTCPATDAPALEPRRTAVTS